MKTYKTIQGDTWDSISYKFYENEKYISNLISENPEYREIAIFSANVLLKIPDISENEVSKTEFPIWKNKVG